MLEALRAAAGTWVAKVLLVLLVISFGVFGISGNLIYGISGDTVLQAGGTTVSATDYRLAYNRQINILSQQFGTQLTSEQAKAIGVENSVLSELTAGALLDEQARQMGLGLSKAKLANLTAEDPAFQGPDGQFDRQRFLYVLQQVGMRPEDYFNNRANTAVRQQIVDATTGGMKAPDAFLRAVALYRGEDRTVDYINLPRSLVEPVEEPAADVLTKWFDGIKARYAAPEYRKIAYARMTPEDILDLEAVTDEQVKQDYDRNIARYGSPETREIEQLVFTNADAAKAAHDAIVAGTKTFDQVVTEQGKSPADVKLGVLTKDRVPDPVIGDAAFKLETGKVSEPIQGAFGATIVRVGAITPANTRTLDEVKDQIRRDIAIGEASRVLLDQHDLYEDARAGGASLKEAAERLKLNLVTIDAIDRTGKRPDGTVVNDIPGSADLLRDAFEAEPNTESEPIALGSNGYVYYELEGITPARERSLDEVRAQAVTDWKNEQANSRLDIKAKDLEKRMADGATIDALAGELKLEKLTKRGLKREADDPDFGKEGVAAVFGRAQGSGGLTAQPSGDGQILFKVAEVFEPAGADANAVPEEARNNFARGMAGDMLDELVSRLRGEYDVEFNQAAAQQALAVR